MEPPTLSTLPPAEMVSMPVPAPPIWRLSLVVKFDPTPVIVASPVIPALKPISTVPPALTDAPSSTRSVPSPLKPTSSMSVFDQLDPTPVTVIAPVFEAEPINPSSLVVGAAGNAQRAIGGESHYEAADDDVPGTGRRRKNACARPTRIGNRAISSNVAGRGDLQCEHRNGAQQPCLSAALRFAFFGRTWPGSKLVTDDSLWRTAHPTLVISDITVRHDMRFRLSDAEWTMPIVRCTQAISLEPATIIAGFLLPPWHSTEDFARNYITTLWRH